MRLRRAFLSFLAAVIAAVAGLPAAAPAGSFREHVRVVERPYLRVDLTVTVVDRQGRPVRGLSGDDFKVFEDGVEMELADFGRESERRDRPLSVAVLLDLSQSMAGQVRKVSEAAQALLAGLRPADEIMVARFNDQLTVLQKFTSDPVEPGKTLGRIGPARGGTALFRSIEETLKDLRERRGRKVILVVSDGLDIDVGRGGSVLQSLYLQDLLRLCFRSQTVVYGIRPGISAASWLPFEGFVEETGGRLLFTGGDLAGLFARLGEELLSPYYLAYDIDPRLAEKRRRRIRVLVRRPEVEVKTVRGFSARRGHVEALLRDLLDDEAQVRADAVFELGFVLDPRSLPALLGAAADRDEQVRRLAALSLGRLGEEAALQTLIERLGDPSPGVRTAAAGALDLFGARAVPGLTVEVARLLSGPPAVDPGMVETVRILGRIGDDRALDPLAAVLREGPAGARLAAADALGALGLTRGIPALRAALADPAPEVRLASARSIVAIAGPAARQVIEAYIAAEADPGLKDAVRALLSP
ncbi:MAG: VWA domain-containing protein [Acidobacteria bacterium]|nr:VWA domain-containing protein [Acidobacteriota bacterium]